MRAKREEREKREQRRRRSEVGNKMALSVWLGQRMRLGGTLVRICSGRRTRAGEGGSWWTTTILGEGAGAMELSWALRGAGEGG